MKILHLSTFDIYGGAAKAAFRLHLGMLNYGLYSRMLVQNKSGNHWSVTAPKSNIAKAMPLLRPVIDSLPLMFYPKRLRNEFSAAFLPNNILEQLNIINPDIVHLHWFGRGFMRIETLKKINKPIVWTFHDMWPFTGGCHVDRGCGRYQEKCGVCPQLASKRENDLSRSVWQRKSKAWRDVELYLVTPSHWLTERAGSSSLFKGKTIKVIPNGLDTDIFKPADQKTSRRIWQLSGDKQIILFGAFGLESDVNKGFNLIQDALKKLHQRYQYNDIQLVVFGSSIPRQEIKIGYNIRYVGRLHDEVSLTILYSAVDVMVVPSYQEAFGQTASEAQACGCPVVAFNATGLKDIIIHKESGYLAMPYEPSKLARGISWVLEDRERHKRLSVNARKRAKQLWSLEKVIPQYLDLYNQAIS